MKFYDSGCYCTINTTNNVVMKTTNDNSNSNKGLLTGTNKNIVIFTGKLDTTTQERYYLNPGDSKRILYNSSSCVNKYGIPDCGDNLLPFCDTCSPEDNTDPGWCTCAYITDTTDDPPDNMVLLTYGIDSDKKEYFMYVPVPSNEKPYDTIAKAQGAGSWIYKTGTYENYHVVKFGYYT